VYVGVNGKVSALVKGRDERMSGLPKVQPTTIINK
jgi:hypothetical protein